MKIAVDFGLAADFDPARGVDISLDLAINEDVVDLDLGFDEGLFADGECAAFGFNRSFEAPVEFEFAGKGERAFEFAIGGEDRGRAGSAGLSGAGEIGGQGRALRGVDKGGHRFGLFLGEWGGQVKQARF